MTLVLRATMDIPEKLASPVLVQKQIKTLLVVVMFLNKTSLATAKKVTQVRYATDAPKDFLDTHIMQMAIARAAIVMLKASFLMSATS